MTIFRLRDGRIVGGGIQESITKFIPGATWTNDDGSPADPRDYACWSTLQNPQETGRTPVEEVEIGGIIQCCGNCGGTEYGATGDFLCWSCRDELP